MSQFSCSECEYTGAWNGLVHHDRQSDCNNNLKGKTIQEFQRVASEMDCCPTREEFSEISNISKNSAVSRFDGSYNNLIIESGFEPNKSFDIGRDDLLNEIKRLNNEYGVVKRELMRKKGKYSPDTCEDRFGSWNDALEEANIDINKIHIVSEEEYLAEIERLEGELGEVPSGHQMNEYGKYEARSYNDKFGTYNEAVRKAGFQPQYEQYAKGEDSHAYGITGKDHPRYGKPPSSTWIENEKTGNKLRSTWEYQYDNLLHESGLDYSFEKETLYFEDFTYLPDFFIEGRFIVEIKGWANESSVKQSEAVIREENREYIVVGGESSKKLKCDKWFDWEDKEDSVEYIEESIQGV